MPTQMKFQGPKSRPLPVDYEERVYAGVLGKIIGVYLGRPFENWTHEHIMKELGEINYYVHERLKRPLVVTDDDISGTFTFVRALEDFAYSKQITAAQIGQTWLNYIIENRTILWWGGMGTSTEHTAFQRLKRGIPAPKSGSIELNGRVVAEQIGAQIFIDGWGMVAPGDPELAAELAKKAGSVSHDGEAVYGGQVIAAMEAQAFYESDIGKLFDTAVRFIPKDCTIRALIDDIRNWREKDKDWKKTRERIQKAYGYDKFGGGCHMIPNHAVIVLALVYCDDDFQKSLMIANTAGWDTDCNSGNVGCLMGIKNGLAAIDAGPDWRGPVSDRLLLPTADGGRCITDAVSETYAICRAGRALAKFEDKPPKNGARFHFELPGSVQGFRFEDSAECRCLGTVWNTAGHSRAGKRSLAIGYHKLAHGRAARVGTPTFVTPEYAELGGYSVYASPTLYPGQLLRAGVEADAACSEPVLVRPFLKHYGPSDNIQIVRGPDAKLSAGRRTEFEWKIPSTGGQPIMETGIEIVSDARADGTVYLDYLTWEGTPNVTFGRPEGNGTFWQKAWVNAADRAWFGNDERPYHMAEDADAGLLIQGMREWRSYKATARIWPHLARQAGLAICVQGLKRYYAVVLSQGNKVQLVKEHYGRTVLAETKFNWEFDQWYELALSIDSGKLTGWANGKLLFKHSDTAFEGGAVALLIDEGRLDAGAVKVEPV
ncbi:MAG TPA: ADP-ribosylglycohydrolase family protein [Planctomycetota bacterium]|nr:ADP-ribosylglycohydrolase family protein [Planctomycetota bacterium]